MCLMDLAAGGVHEALLLLVIAPERTGRLLQEMDMAVDEETIFSDQPSPVPSSADGQLNNIIARLTALTAELTSLTRAQEETARPRENLFSISDPPEVAGSVGPEPPAEEVEDPFERAASSSVKLNVSGCLVRVSWRLLQQVQDG
jgi:hypothetical protein